VLPVSSDRFPCATIDFLLSALRDADAAKWLFRKALSTPSHPQPRVINTDLAPIYTSAIPAIKKKRDASSPMSPSTRPILKQHHRARSSRDQTPGSMPSKASGNFTRPANDSGL
jgi:transposase-like protein